MCYNTTGEKIMKRVIYILILMLIVVGCANRGVGPQGGPRDSIPPIVVMMIPNDGTTNFAAKRIELQFNEYLQLDNVAENVFLSPPTKQAPEVRAVGKKIFVNFLDTLRDSTTYTLEFGSAICDFTEKIPIVGFSYSFSTGDVLDSMEIRGRVVNSEDLNPISGIVVGLHADVHDSAFASSQFENITKTDTAGLFVIRNIHPGRYRIYALGDISRDYIYQPGEGLAFNDSIWETTVEVDMVSDTIWKVDSSAVDSTSFELKPVTDSSIVDTIITRMEVRKGPKDVVLWYFKEQKTRKYFQRAYREEEHLLKFIFAGEQKQKPSFKPLRPSDVDSMYRDSAYVDWMPYTRWSYNKTNDTILCWLTDSIAIRQDSMFVQVTYQRTDSLYNLEETTDTLRCIYRAPRLTEKMAAEMKRKAQNRKLEIKCNASGKFGIGKPIILTLSMPADSVYKDSISLWQKIDTLYKPLNFELEPLDSVGLQFKVVYNWQSEGAYELRYDSAAFRDIYGKVNNASKSQFSVRSIEEYATLKVMLPNYNPQMIVEILNEKGEPLKDYKAASMELNGDTASLLFKNLEPKSFYLRMYLDEDGDSLWTTGDWAKKRQPEKVYYYNKKLTFKANWDFEEVWDYTAQPQLDAKPIELVKDVGQGKKK